MASFNWPQGSPFWSARKYGWKDFGGNVQMDFNTEDQPEIQQGSGLGMEAVPEDKEGTPASDQKQDVNLPFEEAGDSKADDIEPVGEAYETESGAVHEPKNTWFSGPAILPRFWFF